MKKFIFTVFILTSLIFAQNYKIEDFLPDSLTTWQIYGSGDISGSYVDQQYSHHSKPSYSSTYAINPGIDFNYTRIRHNTENYLSISGIYQKNNREDREDYYKRNNYTLSFDYLNNYYFYKNFATKINLLVRYNQNDQKTNINDYTSYSTDNGYIATTETGKQTNNTTNFRTEISPGVMVGRVYSGKYSAKAMEIVTELKKSGVLKRELTKSEFLELSDIIKNRLAIYHYDNRIKKLEAMNDITSYLKSIKVIEENSHEAAFVIEDIYASSLTASEEDNRRFGFRIYGNIITEFFKAELENIVKSNTIQTYYLYSEPSELLTKYYEKDNSTTTIDYFLKGFKLGLVYHKIVNWNFFYNIGLNYQYDILDEDRILRNIRYHDELIPNDVSWDDDYKTEYNYQYKTHRTALSSTAYYKFNSRSVFSLYTKIEYNNSDTKITMKDHDGYKTKRNLEHLYYSVVPQFKYYITPKFNIATGVNFSLTRNFNKNEYYNADIEDYGDVIRYDDHRSNTSAFVRFGYYF